MKTSNKFTLIRLLYAPVFFILYFLPIWIGNCDKLAAVLMCISIPLLIFSEITDGLDGHFARKNNEVSDFGKLFDPFADVMLHISSFLCLMVSYDPTARGVLTGTFDIVKGGYMPIYLFVLIFFREFGQNFLRMVSAKQGVAIAARKGGKFKTVMYIAAEFYAVFLELLVRINCVPSYFGVLKIISFVLFVICVILSISSFVDYLIHFGKSFKEI